jgi:hypothetical protein
MFSHSNQMMMMGEGGAVAGIKRVQYLCLCMKWLCNNTIAAIAMATEA